MSEFQPREVIGENNDGWCALINYGKEETGEDCDGCTHKNDCDALGSAAIDAMDTDLYESAENDVVDAQQRWFNEDFEAGRIIVGGENE